MRWFRSLHARHTAPLSPWSVIHAPRPRLSPHSSHVASLFVMNTDILFSFIRADSSLHRRPLWLPKGPAERRRRRPRPTPAGRLLPVSSHKLVLSIHEYVAERAGDPILDGRVHQECTSVGFDVFWRGNAVASESHDEGGEKSIAQRETLSQDRAGCASP